MCINRVRAKPVASALPLAAYDLFRGSSREFTRCTQAHKSAVITVRTHRPRISISRSIRHLDKLMARAQLVLLVEATASLFAELIVLPCVPSIGRVFKARCVHARLKSHDPRIDLSRLPFAGMKPKFDSVVDLLVEFWSK